MNPGKRSISKWYYILKAAKPLLLSHHPNCKKFESHTLDIKGHRICLGCLVIYPTVILTLILLSILNFKFDEYYLWFYILIGAAVVTLKLIDSENKGFKVIVNFITGLGAGFVIFGIFILPIDLWVAILFLILFVLFTGFLAGYKFDKEMKVCINECEYKRDWSRCPGLKDVYARIYAIENE
jgi:hypothetical protein